MRMVDLLNKANGGYPDGYLTEYYNDETGEFNPHGRGDTLAQFIVTELEETFSSEQSDDDQLFSARHQLQMAVEQLQNTIAALTD